jgi:hypothetical protein
MAGVYLSYMGKVPIPIAASGVVLVLITAAAWRFLSGATLSGQWQQILAVAFMSIVLVATAGFLAIMLYALELYVTNSTVANAAEADLTLEEITSFLNDRSPQTIAEYREGARRHSYQMVSDDVPITGDATSTAQRTQADYEYALADAGAGLVKITTMALSSDVQYVNGTSNRGHAIATAALNANLAAYAVSTQGPRASLNSIPYNRATAWFVPPAFRNTNSRYCQIAYYPGTHLFEVNGDTIWIETTSYGKVKQLEVSLKGEYSSLTFKHAYFVVPGEPPRFSRLPLAQIAPVATSSPHVSECADLFRSVRTSATPWLSQAIGVWDTPDKGSIHLQIPDVTRDVLIVVEGSYQGEDVAK